MIFRELLKESALSQKEAEIIAAFLLGKTREYLLAHPETEISPAVCRKFRELENKRLADWSIAALIGKKEFYGLDFKVDKNVLIPRPETEMIIEEIISLTGKGGGNLMVIDIGTGSGAIIVAAASEIEKNYPEKYKKTLFRAVDISGAALKIAEYNSALNRQDKKIKFLKGNLLEPLFNRHDYQAFFESELILAANLPYLTPRQIKDSPSIKKEPRLALVAGNDGLKYYRELFKQLKAILKIETERPRITLLCEIDPSQAVSIKTLAKKYLPKAEVEIKKDLAGKKRLAIINIGSI